VGLGEVIYINDNKYTVLKQIGEGGFSFVYLCKGPNGKTYALKKMLCQTAEQFKEAKWEIEVMNKIRHPNILEIVDHTVIPHKSIPHFSYVAVVLPYLKRGNLKDVLVDMFQVRRRFTYGQILDIFLQICEAVLQLHENKPKYAHRDIKLENILMDDNDKAYLMDFGSTAPAIVKLKSRQDALQLTELAAQRCTGSYRSPELFDPPSKGVVDERSDVWALGCLLYGLSFGVSPFELKEVEGGSFALAVISGDYSFPEEQPYPTDLIDLIKWLLTIDIKDRPFLPEVIKKGRSQLSQIMVGE